MIEITVDSSGRYQVIYRMQGVHVSTFECVDRAVVLRHLDERLQLEMGLYKGRTFTAGMEKGSSSCK